VHGQRWRKVNDSVLQPNDAPVLVVPIRVSYERIKEQIPDEDLYCFIYAWRGLPFQWKPRSLIAKGGNDTLGSVGRDVKLRDPGVLIFRIEFAEQLVSENECCALPAEIPAANAGFLPRTGTLPACKIVLGAWKIKTSRNRGANDLGPVLSSIDAPP
jgi:hypothetical protein